MDFPLGKNVYCLIDSRASTSLMPEKFARHEGILLARGSHTSKAEGICGNDCINVLGVTEPVPVLVSGFSKEVKLRFSVIECKGFDAPIIGQDFFEHARVCFGKEGGKLVATIED